MLAGETGRFLVPAEGTADPAHFIGRDRFAVAGAAEDNPTVALAPRDRFGGGPDKLRVIDRGFARGAEIPDLVP